MEEKLLRIVPYSAPDGGFAVMMPYHKANSGFLYKAKVHDRLCRCKPIAAACFGVMLRRIQQSQNVLSF